MACSQLVANGWRAILHRRFVDLAHRAAGMRWRRSSRRSLVMLVGYAPSKPVRFPAAGARADAGLAAAHMDPARRLQSPRMRCISGFMVTGLNLDRGRGRAAARHLLRAHRDSTGTRSSRPRPRRRCSAILPRSPSDGASIATRATGMPPLWAFAFAVPLSMLGTRVPADGVLDRISDVNFKRWTAWIVTAVGALLSW